MKNGGGLLTVTYYGSEKVVEHYNLMGPVKAALDASVRYMAAELGDQGIRVHALSPGPLKTRAASGLDRFDELLERARLHHANGEFFFRKSPKQDTGAWCITSLPACSILAAHPDCRLPARPFPPASPLSAWCDCATAAGGATFSTHSNL